jgi:tetratricopeptide (TPR) repeat protein
VAYTSEIDKLEARWRENPKGRNFAPLADAYRKAGLIDNAVMLCQEGLKLHPDYVSAHIVYARCLIDKKDDAGAQDVFKKVLALDGENIIALRMLAEIAGRTGRHDEEVEWLSRLLNADPMNGDAAEALAKAKGKAATKPIAADATTAAMAKPEFTVEHSSPPPTEATVPTRASGQKSADVETFEAGVTFNPAAHAAAKAEGLEVQEDVELNDQEIEQVEVEGLARTQYEGSGMFKLDAPAPADTGGGISGLDLDEAMPQVDLPLLMPDDAPTPRSARKTPPPPPAPPAPPAPPVPAAVALSDDDGAADTAALSQAEPVVTETMAELYLKQGHQQDALRVYHALLAQRPNDPRLKTRVEQLSGGGRKGSGVSAQAFLKGILSGRKAAPEPPPPVAQAAPEQEQSTLASAFDGAGPPPGEPSHPAHDSISLDSVFGGAQMAAPSAASTGSGAGQATPAAGGAGGAAGDVAGGGGFSFDEFFAGAKGGAAPASGDAAAGESPRTPGRSSGRTQKPVEDEAEADQFQQWLKKLKS